MKKKRNYKERMLKKRKRMYKQAIILLSSRKNYKINLQKKMARVHLLKRQPRLSHRASLRKMRRLNNKKRMRT